MPYFQLVLSMEKLDTDWHGKCFSTLNSSRKMRWSGLDECCVWSGFSLCLQELGSEDCLFWLLLCVIWDMGLEQGWARQSCWSHSSWKAWTHSCALLLSSWSVFEACSLQPGQEKNLWGPKANESVLLASILSHPFSARDCKQARCSTGWSG